MDPPEEPSKRMQQCWEAQQQDILKTSQSSHSAWWNLQTSEATTWGDAKAFLASFEQVAAACQWPREEWVARLLPALSGGAQQAFSLLAAPEQEDYRQVKAAILRGEALRREKRRQHFRQFCCPQLGDPRRMYSQVQELCCQWLKPERHSKEQILELLVLEQFLAGLPGDIQSRIQACGPDSGAQAVALLEHFLLSQREADTGTWQEPFQEWGVSLLDAKEEPLDKVEEKISMEHSEIFGNTQQNVDGEAALPGIGMTHPTLLLPPENQDMDEPEPSKAVGIQVDEVMNPKKIEVPLYVVERTQSSQQTMFWKVLSLDGKNMDSLGGGKGSWLKVKNSQARGNEPLETLRTGQQKTKKVQVTAEIKEERCESSGRQGTNPCIACVESVEPAEDLGAICSDSSTADLEGEKALFSKLGFVFEHIGEECDKEYNKLEEKIKLKSKLGEHHSSQIDEQLGIRLHSSSLAKQQIIHTGEKNYKCSNCGKSFSLKSNFLAHQTIHMGKNLQQCPDCGKSFLHRSSMLTHQIIHTVKRPHKCPVCGKGFSQRSILLIHQNVHTGQKPHKCSTCGKNFLQKRHLLSHQTVHTGKKPHQCPDCGRSFLWRSDLLTHRVIHTGEKPHKCANCGKSFSLRSCLLRHQETHTGKKPYQCPVCTKSFLWRSQLSVHQRIHTGEKPYKCPNCEKSFSQSGHLLRHQTVHTRKEH